MNYDMITQYFELKDLVLITFQGIVCKIHLLQYWFGTFWFGFREGI